MTTLSALHHFAESTTEFERNVRNWTKARIDVMALERVLAIVEREGSMVSESEVEKIQGKLSSARAVVNRYEFEIGEVIDRIAPMWRELL